MKTLASPLPIFAGIAAVALLSAMDALIKVVAEEHGTAQIVFLRYGFGVLVALVFLLVGSGRPTRGTFRRASLRVGFILATAYLFFKTLTLLPLAEAVAITFTAPFFMLVASRLILKEPIPARGLAAVAVGFAGILVMAAGRLGGSDHGPLLGYATGLGCSVTYAISMVTMRRDTGHDPVTALVFAQNLLAALISAPFGAATWVPPSANNLWLFALIGCLGSLGHLCFTWAYAHAPASRLATLEYTSFLWATVFGVMFFAELPTAWTLAGAALIVGACFMVFRPPETPAE